jgi:hypothetical protein
MCSFLRHSISGPPSGVRPAVAVAAPTPVPRTLLCAADEPIPYAVSPARLPLGAIYGLFCAGKERFSIFDLQSEREIPGAPLHTILILAAMTQHRSAHSQIRPTFSPGCIVRRSRTESKMSASSNPTSIACGSIVNNFASTRSFLDLSLSG